MNQPTLDWESVPSPCWILGTDTHVGKTHVARLLAHAWAQHSPVVYRKPFQTGVPNPDHPEADARAVAGSRITVETGICLSKPLSPMAAAEAEGIPLDLSELAAWTARPVPEGSRLVLEAAGGVMVPLSANRHFLAWATDFKIPALVVARGGLGTLNHTLLTCEALMLRGWRIHAVVLNPGLDQSHTAAQKNAEVLHAFLPCPIFIL